MDRYHEFAELFEYEDWYQELVCDDRDYLDCTLLTDFGPYKKGEKFHTITKSFGCLTFHQDAKIVDIPFTTFIKIKEGWTPPPDRKSKKGQIL